MAITYVSDSGFKATSGNPFTADAINVTAGNTLIVCVYMYEAVGVNNEISGITDTAGNTYTKAGTAYHFSSKVDMEMWVATNVTGHASNVVSIATDSATGTASVIVLQYSGLATSSVYDGEGAGAVDGGGTTHTTSSTASTTVADALVLALYHDRNSASGTWSASPPYTVRASVDNSKCTADRIVSSTGSYAITATTSGSCQTLNIVKTFKGATFVGSPWYYQAQQAALQ